MLIKIINNQFYFIYISQRTLHTIYNCPTFNETTRNSMKYLFGEFLNIEQKQLPMNNMNMNMNMNSKKYFIYNFILCTTLISIKYK